MLIIYVAKLTSVCHLIMSVLIVCRPASRCPYGSEVSLIFDDIDDA